MPKRTKKHKMQAKDRRTQQRAPRQSVSKPEADPLPSISMTQKTEAISASASLPASFKKNTHHAHQFKLDLLKSVFITIILIGIQIGIYIADATGAVDISSLLPYK